MIIGERDSIVGDIAGDLYDGKTIVLLLPDVADVPEVEYRIWAALQQMDELLVQRLFLTDQGDESGAQFLGNAFSMRWDDDFAPRTIESIFAARILPDVVIFCGFSEIVDDLRRRDWLRTVMEFDALTTKARTTSPTFCLVARASDPVLDILAVKPSLKLRFWYNLRTGASLEAELQLDNPRPRLGEGVWRAALLMSLTNGDRDFIAHLGDVVLRSKDEIHKQIMSYREQENQLGPLQRMGIKPLIYGQCFLPLEHLEKEHPIFDLWTHGLMDFSTEYGWEVPSWALGVLGHTAVLEHRLWRAQIKVVMPLVDRLRLLVIQHFLETRGSAWLRDRIFNLGFWERELESICGWQAEILELVALLDSPGHDSRWERELLAALRLAHSIRNSLAHYNAIEAVEYFDLLQKVVRLEP